MDVVSVQSKHSGTLATVLVFAKMAHRLIRVRPTGRLAERLIGWLLM